MHADQLNYYRVDILLTGQPTNKRNNTETNNYTYDYAATNITTDRQDLTFVRKYQTTRKNKQINNRTLAAHRHLHRPAALINTIDHTSK